MLPKALLIVYKRKGIVIPKYLDNTKVAELLLTEFKKHIGHTQADLLQRINGLDREIHIDYKLIRGLSTLIKRKCLFKPRSTINSREIRTFLFEKGFALNELERNTILEEASNKYSMSKDNIEESIYADLPEEQILKDMEPITAEELSRSYNLSLTQTLLFHATEFKISVQSNFQPIFRNIKMHGLMYEIENDEITITGPLSLFKKTKKYGTSYAKLVPLILSSNKWSITAQIEMRAGSEAKIYLFTLNSSDNILFPFQTEAKIHFDSEVESQFYKEFSVYNTGWELRREPTVIKAGPYAIIPDFSFSRYGKELYLEIVGFWTQEYLEKKIRKLNLSQSKIIVAVNQNLNCNKGNFKGDVIFFEKKVPIKPILNILKEAEREFLQMEFQKIKTIELYDDIVSIQKKASELNIQPDALKILKHPDYFIIGDKFVAKSFLLKMKEKIGKKCSYNEAITILDQYKLSQEALDFMNYTITWKGLVPIYVIEKKV